MLEDEICKKTGVLFTVIFYLENRVVYEIIWKNHCRVRDTADVNTVHAHFALGT